MNWKRNLISLSAAQFVSMIGMSFFLPFIPLFLTELGVHNPRHIAIWSGVLFSAGFVVLSLVAPLWGTLADRWGRKMMVIRALSAGSVILLLTSFVQNPYQLLALRLLHGGFSGFISSSVALIATETPAGSMAFGLGVFQSFVTAGFVVGPLLGGILHDHFGVRTTFRIGAAFLAVGTGLVYVLVQEKHPQQKMLDGSSTLENIRYLLRNKTLWMAARIQFLANLGMMSVQPVIALFVGYLAGLSMDRIGTLAGAVIGASALSMMVGAPFWGRMADRLGYKRVLRWCLLTAGLTFVLQAAAQTVWQLFAARLLLGFFAAGIGPSLQSLIAFHAPVDRKAGILGVSFSITLLGNAVGPFIGGLLAAYAGLRMPFAAMVGVFFMTAWLSGKLTGEAAKPASPAGLPVE